MFPSLKVKLGEHKKTMFKEEVEKSGMVQYFWKVKGICYSLWDEVQITDGE